MTRLDFTVNAYFPRGTVAKFAPHRGTGAPPLIAQLVRFVLTGCALAPPEGDAVARAFQAASEATWTAGQCVK